MFTLCATVLCTTVKVTFSGTNPDICEMWLTSLSGNHLFSDYDASHTQWKWKWRWKFCRFPSYFVIFGNKVWSNQLSTFLRNHYKVDCRALSTPPAESDNALSAGFSGACGGGVSFPQTIWSSIGGHKGQDHRHKVPPPRPDNVDLHRAGGGRRDKGQDTRSSSTGVWGAEGWDRNETTRQWCLLGFASNKMSDRTP